MRHGPTGTERSLDGECCSLSSYFVAHSQVSRVARSSGSAETQAQEENEFIRILWLEIVQGGCGDTTNDQEISKVGGCLIIDAKGVLDAIHRNESAALSMQYKR